MAPFAAIWTRIVYVFDFITGSSSIGVTTSEKNALIQIPIQPKAAKYPIFDPPDDDVRLFQCEYPDYPEEDGWISCNTNADRGCWLKNTKTGERFDIETDYEKNPPKGITRNYYLELSPSTRDADDSKNNIYVQLFNNSFPGPRLQACWGDTISVTIKNDLVGSRTEHDPGNGTTIHWHGFRQWKTGFQDGVNAVTQCPIPPGTKWTYTFTAQQYGTSWYHSHYSLQYAAGALGALTVYGPTSKEYDHQLEPIIMSDWFHQNIYEQWDHIVANPPGRIFVDNTLQNGVGHWPAFKDDNIPPGTKFNTVYFQRGVKYLIRLINGAADTTFVFSIDNHKFWVISTDFVSIDPFETDHIVVGIGQRYNIIVEAIPDTLTQDTAFWMRMSSPEDCSAFKDPDNLPNERTGIVRYLPSVSGYPTTSRGDFPINCEDATYFRNITPIVKREVSKDRHQLPTFSLRYDNGVKDYPYYPCKKSTGHFELIQDHPMWLNFSDPPLLHPNDDYTNKKWLTTIDTGDLTEDQWVQITVLSNPGKTGKPQPIPKQPGKAFVPGQHPIHLHGHDFAIISECVPDPDTECDPAQATFNLINPPRRDVAFLPDGGYLILAFLADNPGAWIMHCHIAMHASMGLGVQILENRSKWASTFGLGWDDGLNEMCEAWIKWTPQNPSDPCMNFDPSKWPLQTDSGV